MSPILSCPKVFKVRAGRFFWISCASAGFAFAASGVASHVACAQGSELIVMRQELLQMGRKEIKRQQKRLTDGIREKLRKMTVLRYAFKSNCIRIDLNAFELQKLMKKCDELKRSAEILDKESAADTRLIKALNLAIIIGNIDERQGSTPLSIELKRWSADLQFQEVSIRASPGVQLHELGVVDGRLMRIYESFWDLSEERRTNLFMFELGKVLWFRINGSDERVAQTRHAKEFVGLMDRNRRGMPVELLMSAPWRGDNLGGVRHREVERPGGISPDTYERSYPLADFAETQSQFAYAFRVAVLNLDPQPEAISQREWRRSRVEMQRYFADLLIGMN